MVEVKFCGITREADAREAARLGARYVGVIMTESLRRVTPDRAAAVREAVVGTGVRTVGVFGSEAVDDIVLAASLAGVEVIQLHGTPPGGRAVHRLQSELGVEVWRVIRVGPDGIPHAATDRSELDGESGILLDTQGTAALGGTGTAFDWDAVAPVLGRLRAGRRFILAGGLRPENVQDAIDRLAPDVVDVSSGIEASPGVKDHQRMAAFMTAVQSHAR